MYYMLLQNMPFICEQDFCRTVLNILTFCSLFIWDDVTNGVGRTVMVQCYEIVNFQLFFLPAHFWKLCSLESLELNSLSNATNFIEINLAVV